jgi:protein TonB
MFVWVALLICFSFLVEQTAPPPPELKPLEARIVELPPAGGLQGGPAVPASAPAKSKTEPAPRPHIRVHRPKPKTVPEPSPSVNGTAKSSAENSTESGSANTSAAKVPSGGIPGGTGSGAAPGIGNDSGGARALYAPIPVIPDELREQAFQTTALAHFEVSYEGQVQVTLTTPTESLRLNQLLLEALKQWRFFPAMKNGVAIDSQFDVQIPIRVQ